MKRKSKPLPDRSSKTYNDLWVAQHMNLKSGAINSAEAGQPGRSARLLELADIALGNKKSSSKKERFSVAESGPER